MMRSGGCKAPNFLVVGAAKSGTTSLYEYLKRHPNVFMPERKEPMYFVSPVYRKLSRRDPRHHLADRKVVHELTDYLAMFRAAERDHTAIGEASAAYLYHHDTAIPRIRRTLGDVRILIVLRDPVDRAFSSYCHLLREGAESLPFEQFLDREPRRREENWDILNFPKHAGLYYRQVKAYQRAFSTVKVVLLDDLKADRERFLEEVFEYLQVPADEMPEIGQLNASGGVPHSPRVARLVGARHPLKRRAVALARRLLPGDGVDRIKRRLQRANRARMDVRTRRQLRRYFREDVLKTQELIGRDLSHWLR